MQINVQWWQCTKVESCFNEGDTWNGTSTNKNQRLLLLSLKYVSPFFFSRLNRYRRRVFESRYDSSLQSHSVQMFKSFKYIDDGLLSTRAHAGCHIVILFFFFADIRSTHKSYISLFSIIVYLFILIELCVFILFPVVCLVLGQFYYQSRLLHRIWNYFSYFKLKSKYMKYIIRNTHACKIIVCIEWARCRWLMCLNWANFY